MHLSTDFLRGVSHAATKIELAVVHADLDQGLSITSSNHTFAQIADTYGLSITQLFSWLINERSSTSNQIIKQLKRYKTLSDESQGLGLTGKAFHIQWSLSLTSDNHLIAFIRDVRWRQKYQDQWTLFERVFNSGRSSIVVTDESNRIVMVNKHFESISGFNSDDVLGLDPGYLGSGRHSKVFYQELWRSLQREGYWSGIIWNKRKDGREYPEQKTIYTVTNEKGVITHYFSSGEVLPDISDAKASEHTCVEGLINQQNLLNQLNENRHNYLEPVAVFHIGIDDIERANRVCGLALGEHLGRTLLQRLSETFMPGSMICHSVGDEFIVVAPHINAPEIANTLGLGLLKTLNSTVSFDDLQWKMTASIGTSFFTPENDAWKAIEQAHIAMHHARGLGGNTLQFYDIESQSSARQNLLMEQALKNAVVNNELSLHYQPLIDLNTNNITSAEALLRWKSEEFGSISPTQFIPIAEQSELISELGIWVFETACKQLHEWGSNYTGTLAINLSAQQIQYVDLPNKLQAILRQYNLPVSLITLEITETAMINDTNSAVSVIAALKQAGFTISMDDFGTGYSSLSYLTRFSLDKLKIDRSFIDTMISHQESLIVTKAIIGLAKG